jgi:hypothetical protein
MHTRNPKHEIRNKSKHEEENLKQAVGWIGEFGVRRFSPQQANQRLLGSKRDRDRLGGVECSRSGYPPACLQAQGAELVRDLPVLKGHVELFLSQFPNYAGCRVECVSAPASPCALPSCHSCTQRRSCLTSVRVHRTTGMELEEEMRPGFLSGFSRPLRISS